MNAVEKRDAAIEKIVNDWICLEEDSLGMLATDAGFGVLGERVYALKAMGRGKGWKAGIDKWIATIEYASKTFCDYNGFSPVEIGKARYSDFSGPHTNQEFARLLKWAVVQGSTYAYIGNR